MKHRLHNGFSLVELAIALSIIGLLLTLSFKGQALLTEVDVKNAIAVSQDLSRAIRDFKERYHYLPGDLPKAGEDIPGLTPACTNRGGGNGLIDTLEEIQCVPDHLYRAGYISGGKISNDSEAITLSVSYRGTRGKVNIVARRKASFAGLESYPQSIQHIMEFESVPAEIAEGIDRQLDDGNLETGNVRRVLAADIASVGASDTSREDIEGLVLLAMPL
jgi:prepilin-type N-terminal cleavage/methylation domain-containing protein